MPRRQRGAGNPAWTKGVSGNPNGRPKGCTDKITREVKEGVLQMCTEVGGIPEFLRLYERHEWAKQLLWKTYFDMIPKKTALEGDPDKPLVFRWEGNETGNNGPV